MQTVNHISKQEWKTMGQMHACHLCSLPERQEANRSPQPIPTALQHCSEEQFSSMESSSATQKAGIHTGATPVCAQLTSLFISPSAKFKHCNLLRGALTESLQKDRAQADQDWPCKVFLTSLHWAWPASENSISRCFMKAFFFSCCFMNTITMPRYTLDHSFT